MNELTRAVCEIARSAGTILREATKRPPEIHHKGPIDLVTDADHASETYVLREIRRRFPSHSILSEESGKHESDGEYRWVVDPLDGTVNFAHGLPHFSALLAVQARRGNEFVTVSAATYDPMRDEMFWAEQGGGAYLGDARIRVAKAEHLIDTIMASGLSYDRLFQKHDNLAEFCRLSLLTQGIRRGGSAGLDLAYVACGRLDGYWEYSLQPWDMAGGCLLVTEAGGVVTQVSGTPVDVDAKGGCLATNSALHATLRAALASACEAPVGSREGLGRFLPPELAARLGQR